MTNDFLDLHPDNAKWQHAHSKGLDGVRLHYTRQGQGKPVLFLHGWPGFWYDWRAVIPKVISKVDAIAPDFRGFNASDKPTLPSEKAYTPQIFTDDLLHFLEELDLSKVILVAYDIGAIVAQLLVHKAPERVESLVLINPPYPGIGERILDPESQRERWFQYFHLNNFSDQLVSYDWVTLHLYINHFYRHWLYQKTTLRPKEFEAIVDIYSREELRPSLGFFRSSQTPWKYENFQDLPSGKIDHKTTILWTDKDPMMPFEWSDRLSEFFTQGKLVPVKEVGHFLCFEKPEPLVEVIFDHL